MDSFDRNTRGLLIEGVRKLSESKLKPEIVDQFVKFCDDALHIYPHPDYLDRPAEHFFWAIYGLYEASLQRKSGTTNLRAFSPTEDRDGWPGTRSMIYINREDSPFLLSSVRLLLNRERLDIFTTRSTPIWVARDEQGNLQDTSSQPVQGMVREAVVAIEIDLHSDPELQALETELRKTISDLALVVDDYAPMQQRLTSMIGELRQSAPESDQLNEVLAFLEWLNDDHFIFLGCVEYDLIETDKELYSQEAADSRIGLFRTYGSARTTERLKLTQNEKTWYAGDEIVTFTKSSVRSHVHRDVYSDYVVIKRFNEKQQSIGEIRLLGLYSSAVYAINPNQIPLIRQKISWVMNDVELGPATHDGKVLTHILENHPHDELFYAAAKDLKDTALGIWQIYERRTVKVFMQSDIFNKFVSCLIFLPRDNFSTDIREQIQQCIAEKIDGYDCEFDSDFMKGSALVRLRLVFQIDNKKFESVENLDIEKTITQLTRGWEDRFTEFAIGQRGETEGLVFSRQYKKAFPASYRDRSSTEDAYQDSLLASQLTDSNNIAITLDYLPPVKRQILQMKLFHTDSQLALSDVIPILENMGFRVLVERPHLLQAKNQPPIWLQDFHLSFPLADTVDVPVVRDTFREALRAILQDEAEDDNFNRLVLGAALNWRSVAVLRLYARYLKQLGVNYSQAFIADTLSKHLGVTQLLVQLFECMFDPQFGEHRADRAEDIRTQIVSMLDAIENVNEDDVLRLYVDTISATLRTNFYQQDAAGNRKPCIAIKLQTRNINQAPKPRPAFEVFVYSTRVEGVHLRGGKVARGGLRWSDRIEDYRTEVLGLVKAQQVKNAVIVPTGAKGGFVAKQLDSTLGREAVLQEGVECYKIYIQALLDITDNLVAGELVAPDNVIRWDDDDPYLVVAADKGTATFSDIANSIAEHNNFWLGDAFASGGSYGYDHKRMGITAKGSWVAVQRHFREMGINIQEQDFTVVGIGDMGGDVFGNGMLLSEHIQLVAAFNHMHIFVDPYPNAADTYIERKRLFEMPRSSWDDFDKSLMSTGGAVYSRSAKSLKLSPEIKRRFNIRENRLTPNAFISKILRAQVDLIWNGGIGTYVKSSAENNAEVGDRANDQLRIDGNQMRCRVFGEGGNLGMTQSGRVEFCLHGGVCNTDFIDNAAGVDCSDHEVNIKILLNELVAVGKLSVKDRNLLLASMTDSVSELVLANSYRQTLSISLSQYHADKKYAEYGRFMDSLEKQGRLDPVLEFLPDEEQFADRIRRAQPVWTRPELSVLISYAKMVLKEELLEAELMDDPILAELVYTAFPPALKARYEADIANHRLRKEIVSTQLANDLVNRMGFTFCYRQMESTGARVDEVIKAYVIVIHVLGINSLWEWVESCDFELPASNQHDIQHILISLVRRVCRWFLRNRRQNLDCAANIEQMKNAISLVLTTPSKTEDSERMILRSKYRSRLLERGVNEDVADIVSTTHDMFLSTGIVDIAQRYNKPVEQVAELYFELGEQLTLDWFMSELVSLEPGDFWQDLAREAYVDDLESQRRQLTAALLKPQSGKLDTQAIIDDWQEQQRHLIDRWKGMVGDLRHAGRNEFAMMSVALRELLDLVQSTVDSAQEFEL